MVMMAASRKSMASRSKSARTDIKLCLQGYRVKTTIGSPGYLSNS